MNPILDKIRNISQSIAEASGFFLIDLSVRGDKNKRIIEIFIDGERNITAEDLAKLSREIQQAMELDGTFNFPYRLDVSSPGTDRPLKYLKQFPKHLNRMFEVEFKSGEVTGKIKGKLMKIDSEDLYFTLGNKNEIKINFNEIKKAKVIISFT